MAAIIDGITLQGFKSLDDTTLSIERLNVLIGANGTGKSNFLALFRMLSAIMAGELQPYVLAQGGAASLLHYGPKKTSAIVLLLDFNDQGKPSRYEVALTYSPMDRLHFTHEMVSRDVGEEEMQGFVELMPGNESKLEKMISWGGDQAEAAREVRANLAGIRVYHFHDTSDTAAVKQTGDLNDNRSLRGDAGNLASFLYMLRQAHPAHYAEIRETIRLAFPLFGDFVLEPSRLNPNALLLRWRERGSDYDLGAHQLSDGTLRFICLATLLLQPFEHPDAPRVVVIDEPELGLHPYALTLLASMLKSASEKAQVIVSTQSASLLGAIDEPTSVVIVERHDGATTLRRCTAEEVAPWLEEYSLGDIWEKGILGASVSRLLILCEGQTEETFLKQLIVPHLADRGVFAQVTMIATSRDSGRRTHRGGHAHRFDLIARDLRALLGSRPDAVSTMLDLYGFPRDMPGFPASWPPTTQARVGVLEAAFAAAIADHRFIPGIVAHEFEALLFTDPERIAAVAVHEPTERTRATAELVAVAQAYASPEDINDSPETAPSKRIMAAVPGYKKPRHGPVIAQGIGLARLRASCPLWASWLTRLEALGAPTAPA